MSLVVIGLSHRTAPVELRERFAFAESGIPATLQRLRESKIANEAVILSTCNRVEIYISTHHDPGQTFTDLQTFLVDCHEYRDPLNDEIYFLKEPDSLEHLFKVACGLDSMVLGETEILGQLKKAYDLALQHKHTGGILNKAFQSAFNTAKHIRTATNIQRGSISVASVAVELAERIFSSLQERQVMIIGAGETGEKTARALLSRGAHHLLVTNRSPERAEALARDLGGRAVPFDAWDNEFEKVDIIISSTSAPGYILDSAKVQSLMHKHKHRPLLLIDIAVPRDIAPEVNLLDGVYLYNIDDLQSIAEGYLKQRKEEVVHCMTIIRSKVTALLSNRQRGQQAAGDAHPALE